MESENIVTFQLQLTRRKAWLLLTVFFICWHPGFLGSETLTLTTYYPAPFGGYVSLLTTGRTLLARDGGNVGVGMATPGVRLEVVQNGAIKIGNAYLSSGGDFTHLANNEWYNGASWTTNGSPGVLYQQSGQNNTWYTHNGAAPPVHTPQMSLNSGGLLSVINLSVAGTASFAGNVNVTGQITGSCRQVPYSAAGQTFCGGGEKVFGAYGDGVIRVWGFIVDGAGTPVARIGMGTDWAGQMVCCRITN